MYDNVLLSFNLDLTDMAKVLKRFLWCWDEEKTYAYP